MFYTRGYIINDPFVAKIREMGKADLEQVDESKKVGEYYHEYDDDSKTHGVFHTDKGNGKAFSTHSTATQAKAEAEKRNKAEGFVKESVLKNDETTENLDEAHGVFLKGGSIGEKRSNEPVKIHDNKEDAVAHAKRMNKMLSPGEKKHYGLKYHVKPIKEYVEDFDDDLEMTFEQLEYACENFESLDEVSKAVLGRYIKKAKADYALGAVGNHASEGKDEYAKKLMTRRKKGIDKAVDKLTKEDVNLNNMSEIQRLIEISKKTLGSYVNKAVHDIDSKAYVSGRYAVKGEHNAEAKNDEKIVKRQKGIRKAVSRLTKEDVEYLDELSKNLLNRYAQKAAKEDGENILKNGGEKKEKNSFLRINKKMSSEEIDKAMDKHNKKYGIKHDKGISLAQRKIHKDDSEINFGKQPKIGGTGKLTKEDVEYLDELSKKTLGSYVSKASSNVAHHSKDNFNKAMDNLGMGNVKRLFTNARSKNIASMKKNDEIISKREKGIKTAERKLTKEEVEFIESALVGLDEALNPYAQFHKHKEVHNKLYNHPDVKAYRNAIESKNYIPHHTDLANPEGDHKYFSDKIAEHEKSDAVKKYKESKQKFHDLDRKSQDWIHKDKTRTDLYNKHVKSSTRKNGNKSYHEKLLKLPE